MPTADEMIEFLLSRKFPDHQILSIKIRRSRQLGHSTVALSRRQKELSAYDEELRALPPDSLEATYDEEMAAHRNEVARAIEESREKAEQEERRRFFNLPYAQADFMHWSKAAYWTIDEAVALSFGKEPEAVTWSAVKPLVEVSPFAVDFARLRDLALRAEATGQLYEKVHPGFYLAWAKRYDIPYPPELEKEVKAHGHRIEDWKTLYEDSVHELEVTTRAANARDAENKKQIANFESERDRLNRQIEELQSGLQSAAAAPTTLSTKERESALKLIIGMALAGYKYNPSQQRNLATTEIGNDLAGLGIPLDPDTIRKFLKEGGSLLSRETLEEFDRSDPGRGQT